MNKENNMFKIMLKNELFLSFISIVMFILLLLTSCASGGPKTDTLHQMNASSSKTEKLNSALSQTNTNFRKTSPTSDYKIGPEDLLEIETFQVQDLKSTVRVSAQGFIKIPLVDKIEAAGLTVSELESLIATRLKKYVQEPVVSIFIKEYRSQQIVVLGSVKDPKTYYATGQKYLLDMLSMAGGLTPDAGSVCIIQRPVRNGSDDKEIFDKIVVDLDLLLIYGSADLNIPIFSGDILQVPRSGIFFVDGAVRAPGEYPIKNNTTFTQAIGMAKGKDYTASDADMKLYRDNGNKGKEIISVDYSAVLAGESPDILIKDKDIIVVSTSTIKRILNTLSGAANFGGFVIGGGRPF